MKNKFIIILIFLLLTKNLLAENLNIQSKEISIDKKTKITIFKDNVVAIDEENNNIRSNYAKYNKDDKILESMGETIIETSEGYVLTGNDIVFDNAKNYIKSNNPAVIKDLENNDFKINGEMNKFLFSIISSRIFLNNNLF